MHAAGKTLAENLENLPDLKEGQMLIYPIDRPIKQSGHIQIMYGNLAPEGCVGKITGKEGLEFEGPARVFDSEEDMLRAVEAGPQKFKVNLSQGYPLSILWTFVVAVSFITCYALLQLAFNDIDLSQYLQHMAAAHLCPVSQGFP